MEILDEIKERLGVKIARTISSEFSGCINKGTAYELDSGDSIFVKSNADTDAGIMFEGEIASLTAIRETNTVRAPKPLLVVDLHQQGKGSAIVMEFFPNMKGVSSFQAVLGEKLANLHLDNMLLEKKFKKLENWVGKPEPERKPVEKFGFHAVTCCGKIPLVNEWEDDWVSFYARHRLDYQIRLIQEEYGHREVGELWSKLQLILPKFFQPLKDKSVEIKPSLLHGDLWGGNAGEITEGPVIYDPASFYGHHEHELSISSMFGGFNSKFYNAYHKIIPKESGFGKRQDLYQLFHYLNHWNHFGSGYSASSLSIMKSLTRDS